MIGLLLGLMGIYGAMGLSLLPVFLGNGDTRLTNLGYRKPTLTNPEYYDLQARTIYAIKTGTYRDNMGNAHPIDW